MSRFSSQLRALTDSTSVQFGVVSSGAVGMLALVDPAKCSPAGRFAYRTANAALVAYMASVRPQNGAPDALSPSARIGLTAGAVGLTYGLAEWNESMDARFQNRLRRAGVRHPRVAIALASGGLSAAAFFDIRRVNAQVAMDLDEPTLRALPGDVRSLLEAMLERTEDYGSLALRDQLNLAAEETWDKDMTVSQFIVLSVPDELPRAVPGNADFPVRARFTAPEGSVFEASIGIVDGLLASVDFLPIQIDGGSPDPDAEPPELSVWPSVDDVVFLIETREGLVAIT